MKQLGRFPEVIQTAAEFFEPVRLTDYLFDVAQLFHHYYNHHRIITSDRKSTEARVLLSECVRTVIKNGLTMLGVSAPEEM